MARIGKLKLASRAEQGATLIVRDWNGTPDTDGTLPPLTAEDGSPVTITVQGIDSPTARTLAHRRAAKLQSQAYQTVAAGNAATQIVVTEDDIADLEAATVDQLVALTIDWHGFEDDDGQPLPCTADAARELYAQCQPIREQVSSFVNDRKRFFGSSATPSGRSPGISSRSDAKGRPA